MHKRTAGVAAVVAALTMAVAGTASASILQGNLSGVGGYDSDGTFEGINETVDQACREAGGQQDVEAADGLSASACDARPADEGDDNGSEAATADTSALPGVPGVLAITGYGSDGTIGAVQDACGIALLLGIPVEGQTVGDESASLSVCVD